MMMKSISILSALFLGVSAAAHAADEGGLQAQCTVNGAPVALDLRYEVVGNTGIALGPGVNPDIIGVISSGASTVYWTGAMRAPNWTVNVSGADLMISFYDPNVYNRETTLQATWTSPSRFYLEDARGNYPGRHPCQVTNLW